MAIDDKIAPEMIQYLDALVSKGLFEVKNDQVEMTPLAKELVDAMHVALSGGKVAIDVESEGDAAIKSDLDGKLDEAVKATNTLNAASGPGVYAP